jgi:hypothetical protein
MSKEVPYRQMSIGAKQAAHRDRMREPAIVCPHCETQTTVADLPRHVKDGCQGRREPHPLAKWVSWSEVVGLGVAPMTLHDWVRRGEVKSEGPPRGRRYLLRDVVRLLARQLRKSVRTENRSNGTGKDE